MRAIGYVRWYRVGGRSKELSWRHSGSIVGCAGVGLSAFWLPCPPSLELFHIFQNSKRRSGNMQTALCGTQRHDTGTSNESVQQFDCMRSRSFAIANGALLVRADIQVDNTLTRAGYSGRKAEEHFVSRFTTPYTALVQPTPATWSPRPSRLR